MKTLLDFSEQWLARLVAFPKSLRDTAPRLQCGLVVALAMTLSSPGCGSPPEPLPFLSFVEGSGLVLTDADFVIIGIDVAEDAGGLDGKLDYFFLCETQAPNNPAVQFSPEPRPLKVSFDKSKRELEVQSGESLRMRFHVHHVSDLEPDGTTPARAIYYRVFDTDDALEIGSRRLLEDIREMNDVVTPEDCKAGGVGAVACETNNRTCGVVAGEGLWACCQPDQGGFCHVAKAASSPSS